MRLPCEFIRLPLQFDAEPLRQEIAAVDESEWLPHPQGFAGNSALILVSVDGEDNNDLAGPMAPTPRLQRCSYLRQVMASFQTVVGRSRLMRLDPGSEVKLHTDLNYYWRDRIRVHVPIVTDPGVRFQSGDRTVHMGAGEAWVFDNWRPHTVINDSGVRRIHLVMDTVGTAAFWQLVGRGWNPASGQPAQGLHIQRLEFDSAAEARFPLERFNVVPVAMPASVKALAQDLIGDIRSGPDQGPAAQAACALLGNFSHEWQGLWAAFGSDESAFPHFRELLDQVLAELRHLGADKIHMPSNGSPLLDVANAQLGPLLNDRPRRRPTAARRVAVPRFERPLIVVSAPRSGSTLLFETLARLPGLWTIGKESHGVFEGVDALRPENRGFDSNAVGREELTPQISASLRGIFAQYLRDAGERPYQELAAEERPDAVRFLEKTPKNALRIPFLDALFPDALFVFLHRDPRPNISSLIDGWRSGRFVTYRELPGWKHGDWSFLLTPGWRELDGKPVEEIAAAQWRQANEAVMDALESLPRERWCSLSYEQFIADPAHAVRALAEFAGLAVDEASLPGAELPHSRYTLSAPDPEKWRRNQAEVERVLPTVEATFERLQALGNGVLRDLR